MGNLELVILSFALGTDLFSVAIPLGMKHVTQKIVLKAAAVFAIFHIVMILTGYHIGHFLGALVEKVEVEFFSGLPMLAIQNWASMLGAAVLIGLGARMIKSHADEAREETVRHALTGFPLLLLAFSVSIDALAAGFSLGMMDVDLIKLSAILGGIIFLIALSGLGLGRKIGKYVGKRAEVAGGIVLIILGLNIIRAVWG